MIFVLKKYGIDNKRGFSMPVDMGFYESDEGISVGFVLSAFGPSLVQCINLESDSVDEKMKKDIDFLFKKQKDFFEKITTETQAYSKRIYGDDAKDLILLKFIFPQMRTMNLGSCSRPI